MVYEQTRSRWSGAVYRPAWGFVQALIIWVDLLAGLLHGGRVSITIGLVAAMSVFIGISFGAFAGYYYGYVEEVLMRILNFQVLPTLLFSMVIVALFGARPDDHDCDWSVNWTASCSDNGVSFCVFANLNMSCLSAGNRPEIDLSGYSAQCPAANHCSGGSDGWLNRLFEAGLAFLV